MPVDKGEGDPVYTGTVNQFGRLEIRAEKLGTETTLGQVIRLLADAQRHRSPLERTADRYARLFLPAVLTVAALVFLATNGPALWRWIGTGAGPEIDLMPALAVLVVACPCALVLATPAAVLAATARLARRGVLVKGGAAIEGLARVNTIAFDKTGTLTEGKPELGDCIALGATGADVRRRARTRSSDWPPRPSSPASTRWPGCSWPRRAAADWSCPRSTTFRPSRGRESWPGCSLPSPVQSQARAATVLVGNLRLVREHGVAIADRGRARTRDPRPIGADRLDPGCATARSWA